MPESTRLQDYLNEAKTLIAEAETMLDEKEFKTWRAIVLLALTMQKSEAA